MVNTYWIFTSNVDREEGLCTLSSHKEHFHKVFCSLVFWNFYIGLTDETVTYTKVR
jgi:hypothetical protein